MSEAAKPWQWPGTRCPTLCNPMECIVHGILQARIPEWEAFPFSGGSSQPRDLTQVSLLDKKKKIRINESLGVWCKHILFETGQPNSFFPA